MRQPQDEKDLKQFLSYLIHRRLELVEEASGGEEGPSDAALNRIVTYHHAIAATEAAIKERYGKGPTHA